VGVEFVFWGGGGGGGLLLILRHSVVYCKPEVIGISVLGL